MSLALLGVLAMVLVGALVVAIGISLMTNFRDSVVWWKQKAAESRGVSPEAVFGDFSDKSMQLIVGGAFVLVGAIAFVLAMVHV